MIGRYTLILKKSFGKLEGGGACLNTKNAKRIKLFMLQFKFLLVCYQLIRKVPTFKKLHWDMDQMPLPPRNKVT